jgi:Uma2 family endonuclease
MSIDLREHAPGAAESPADRAFRLTEDQFRRMTAADVFGPGESVALVDGVVRQGSPSGAPYRFRLDQYHRMGKEGILSPSDRVELLEGRLVSNMSINPPHRLATRKTRIGLEGLIPRGWYVDQQAPVSLPRDGSEPEPDVQVVRGDSSDYANHHPGPEDIALLVEVSDATLADDRRQEKALYASEGISVYWIINLRDERVEVHDEPSGPSERPDYDRRLEFARGEAVPVVLDGRPVGMISVDDLLP